MNACSQEQILHGFWYYDLIPEAVEKVRSRCIPLEVLRRLLEENGFTYGDRIVPVDAVLQQSAYLDPRGPLHKGWRDGDSIWSLVDPEELERACERIRSVEANGALQEYVARLDRRRSEIGQTTFLYATR